MAGNKKISQLVDGGAGQAGDNYVIERGGVNFKVDNESVSGNPGGLNLNGNVNDMIVKDEKAEVALEQRQTLPAPISFVDNTAVPPTEVDGDIYLLDDTGASDAAWDGNPANTWVRFDGTATLWKGIAPIDGMICTIQDTGDLRYFNPTSSVWETLGGGTPAGANTEIQFNNLGAFGASSLFTFSTAFGQFRCDADTVFNDSGTDQDFRIEGLSEVNMFFVEASTDRIGIATNSPRATVDIRGVSQSASNKAFMVFDSVATAAAPLFEIKDNGNIGIGKLATIKFDVEDNTDLFGKFKSTGTTAEVSFFLDNDIGSQVAMRIWGNSFGQDANRDYRGPNKSVFYGTGANGTYIINGTSASIKFSTGNGAIQTTKVELTTAGNLGIGGTPASVALLEVTSTTKAFRITPMTAAQAVAITAIEGLMVFVSDTDATFTTIGFWGYENGVWTDL